MPKIGCGLAGGEWELVKGIVQEELVDHDVAYFRLRLSGAVVLSG
jgi:hypothetical protein